MSVMVRKRVGPIENSSPDDLFIACVSFEPRCLNVSTSLKKEYKTCQFLLIKYYGEDPLKHKHEGILKNVLKNHIEGPLREIEPENCDKYELSGFINFLHAFSNENPSLTRITIDISTFTKQYLLILLRHIRSNYPNATIRLLYTPGYYNTRQSLSWGIKDITYLPLFGSIDKIDSLKNILILLLGYEGERAYAIWKYIDPDLTVAVIGSPPSHHGADLPSRSANRIILSHPNTIEEEIPSLDPNCTRDLLNRWYFNEKYENYMFSIAPLGTKMQTVGLYLFFEESNNAPRAQIIYASPLLYNKKKYTTDYHKNIREFYLPPKKH
jgi:hypothetical protein